MRKTTVLNLAMLIAGTTFVGCAAETTEPTSSLEVAGGGAELRRDDDNDGHDDNDDSWRCGKGYGNDKHNRNRCPAVDALAQPSAVKVGQTMRLKGFAFDNDGPRSLKYSWTVTPATIGTIANKTSKRTTLKCLVPGKGHVTFSVTDGDCTRNKSFDVECQPTTAAKCGDGAKNGNELCDNSSSNAADKCPTSCNDDQACTTDTLLGTAATCDAHCTHTDLKTCSSNDGCCPSGCTNPADLDCKPTCGDKVKNGTETCDDSSPNAADKCPKSCDDGNACTKDILSGSGATCNAVCGHETIPGCVQGCGDGVFDSTKETCDNSSSTKCPTSCDDSNACTKDGSTGSAATCDFACKHDAITACGNGDGCCAPGCNSTNDDSCTIRCGNGILEPGEKCDGNCPTSCVDTDNCTTDKLVGSAATCDAVCTHTAVTTCSTAGIDLCCPAGCDGKTDSDCIAKCNNGVIEPGETCDPLTSCPTSCNDNKACTKDTLTGDPTKCTAACVNDPITACVSNDGCCAPGCKNPSEGGTDNDCMATPPSCGDKVKNGSETCDDSSPVAADHCPTSCDDGVACTTDLTSGSAATCNVKCDHTPITVCTTGVVGDKCCPSGCNANNDGDCVPTCPNGVKEGTELCDGADCPTAASCNDNNDCTSDVITGSAATCDAVCTHTALTTPACLCGNGKVDAGETCDGAASCAAEAAKCNDNSDCTIDTVTGSAATCNIGCTHAPSNTPQCLCGNGKLDPGEKCDGNCPTSCTGGTACTPKVLTGTAASCTAECVDQPITACVSGDSCCPAGCTNPPDAECQGADPCRTCELLPRSNKNCVNSLNRCETYPGVDASTPPKNLSDLCKAEVACIHSKKCAANGVPTDCLCGDGADPGDCFASATLPNATFNGACAAEIIAAAQSAKGSDLNTRFFDPDFASGAADAVIETCDQFFCVAECL